MVDPRFRYGGLVVGDVGVVDSVEQAFGGIRDPECVTAKFDFRESPGIEKHVWIMPARNWKSDICPVELIESEEDE
jgi:hypothetical protein